MTQETLFYTINEIPARCRDSKDNYLLELALISEADYPFFVHDDFESYYNLVIGESFLGI